MQSQHHSQSFESRSGEDCGGEQQALARSIWEMNSQRCRKNVQMIGCKIEGGVCDSELSLGNTWNVEKTERWLCVR